MELWTLGELAERVEAALADYPGQVNGRVRAVPDQRAIRWYTTTGLIDRPAEMRGRTALYSHRHLLQLVAIKRRQSQGHTLAQIQSELTGATNETLHPIAALPTPSGPPAGSVVAPAGTAATSDPLVDRAAEPPPPPNPRFWAGHQPRDPADAPAPPAHAELVTAVRLAAGITLILDHPGVVDPTRLATAAAPLLAELTRQGLLPRSSGDET